jgi:hypothetical protein
VSGNQIYRKEGDKIAGYFVTRDGKHTESSGAELAREKKEQTLRREKKRNEKSKNDNKPAGGKIKKPLGGKGQVAGTAGDRIRAADKRHTEAAGRGHKKDNDGLRKQK